MELKTILLISKLVLQVNDMVLLHNLKEANKRYIQRIDELEEKVDAAILMDLKAMQKCLEDFRKADAFTSSNVEFLRNTLRKYTGLPLEGKTAGVENRKIVATSYLGLITFENMSENPNQVLIARYVFRMFEASPGSAKKSFPEIHAEFFQPVCDKLEEQIQMDMAFVDRYCHSCLYAGGTELKQLCEILKRYQVSFDITDWKKGATSLPGKLAGAIANKAIGAVHIDCSTIIKVTEGIKLLSSSDTTKVLLSFLAGRIIYALKEQIPKYKETLIFKEIRKAAQEHLKSIDTEHIGHLPPE